MPKRGFTLQWHITDKCNLQCTHCYRDSRTEELSHEKLTTIADTLLEGVHILDVEPCFAMSGGEPFLRENFFELVDYLYEKGGANVLIETNGTLIDSRIISQLNSHSPPIHTVQVSLDGSNPPVNDKIRGKGAFEKALSGLKRVIQNTSLFTAISYTFHAENAKDIPSIVALGESIGVDGLYLTRLVPIGHGKGIDIVSAEETQKILVYLHEKNEEFKKLRKNGVKKPIIAENRCLFHLVDPEEAIKRYATGGERLGNACAIGFSTFTILSDGTAVPCRRLPIPLGNLLEESFLNIWFKNDLLWEFRRREKILKGKCRTCPFLKYRGLCDGGASCVAYGYYHDYNQPDPQCWYQPGPP